MKASQPTLQTILEDVAAQPYKANEAIAQATTQIETIINSELRTKLEGLLAESKDFIPDTHPPSNFVVEAIPVAAVLKVLEEL